jgi:hypothetical protein
LQPLRTEFRQTAEQGLHFCLVAQNQRTEELPRGVAAPGIDCPDDPPPPAARRLSFEYRRHQCLSLTKHVSRGKCEAGRKGGPGLAETLA